MQSQHQLAAPLTFPECCAHSVGVGQSQHQLAAPLSFPGCCGLVGVELHAGCFSSCMYKPGSASVPPSAMGYLPCEVPMGLISWVVRGWGGWQAQGAPRRTLCCLVRRAISSLASINLRPSISTSDPGPSCFAETWLDCKPHTDVNCSVIAGTISTSIVEAGGSCTTIETNQSLHVKYESDLTKLPRRKQPSGRARRGGSGGSGGATCTIDTSLTA